MDVCRFCQIIDGERDAHVLLESDRAVAFLDRNPIAKGHTLLVPTEHVEGIDTMDEGSITELFTMAGTVTHALRSVLDADGFSMFHTTGPLIGTIDHAHVHLVPRYQDDNIHIALPRDELDRDRDESLAEDLIAALDQLD